MDSSKNPLVSHLLSPVFLTGVFLRVVFLTTIFLTGCLTAGPTPSAAPSPLVITPTPTAEPPTATPLPAPPTLTPIPTAEPSFTATSLPTLTPTATPTPTPSPIRFAVIGDYGLAGQPAEAVATLVHNWQPDFIITTGDNNYPSGQAETIDENIGQYYAGYIYPYTGNYGPGAEGENRFFPSLGNHDWDAPGIQPYLDYFVLPGNERYYNFTWGPVHFFAVNSDSREPDGVSQSSVQAAWLEQGLAASELPWKIVYGHLSPYSSATHGGIAWMNWPFAEWGAAALIAGHDHVYERIVLEGEFPYLINGLGGGPRYAFAALVPGSVVRYRDNHGAMLVTADWQQITFQFFTIEEELVDTYTLTADAP
jgi:hypothetical protein